MQLARRKELRLAHVRYPFQMLRQVALRKKGRVSTSKGEMRKREMQKWDDDDQKELVGERRSNFCQIRNAS